MSADTSSSSLDKQKPANAVPLGMILGPDGKPCKVCTAFRNWKPGTTNYTEPNSKTDRPATRNTSINSQNQKQSAKNGSAVLSFPGIAGVVAGPSTRSTEGEGGTSTQRPDEPPPGCPPDVEQLGRATWTFLHTTAAYYPDKPTPTQRANMLMLIRSLPVLYPCGWCADDLGGDIKMNPPDVSSRTALSLWLCERHNTVNEKLGKERFDCARVDERWKDGPSDGRCD